MGLFCSFLLSSPVFHQLCWGFLNENSLTLPLDRMRGTDDWALAVLMVAGQETLWPTGSFLAGETQQSPVWGTSERVGWLPTKPGMAASARPQFMGILPWLPREVLSLDQLSKWSLSSSPQLRRSGEMEIWPVVPRSLSWGVPSTSRDIVGLLLWLGPPRVFNSQSCPHGASRSSLFTAQVFLPQYWLGKPPWWCLLQSLCSCEPWLHVHPSLQSCACVLSCSVMSDSWWPHGLQPARFLCPWDYPVKNTGMSYHFHF